MKRFKMGVTANGVGYKQEHLEGEWVRWDDVVETGFTESIQYKGGDVVMLNGVKQIIGKSQRKDKQHIRELFEELLVRYENAKDTVNDEYSIDLKADALQLKQEIAEWHKRIDGVLDESTHV